MLLLNTVMIHAGVAFGIAATLGLMAHNGAPIEVFEQFAVLAGE